MLDLLYKVSVVMSVYNGADYLNEAVTSVLNQTFREFEFIIIDDGSTDNTWDILEYFANSDNRIILVKNRTNIGLTRSLNKGLGKARGQYIARQDHDDLSEPARLERQIQYLDMHESCLLVSCNYDIVNSEGNLVKRIRLSSDPTTINWNLLFYNYLGGHSQVMFRRDPVLLIGGYSESFRYAQDYDLWLRLSKLGEIYILPERLMKYRVHDDRVTSVAADDQFDCVLKASSNRIAELIGYRLLPIESKRIWAFWCLVHESKIFHSNLGTFISVQLILRQIFRAFVAEQRSGNLISINQNVRKIRYSIAKRCLTWSRFEFINRRNFRIGMALLIGVIYWMRFDLIYIWIRSSYNLFRKNA